MQEQHKYSPPTHPAPLFASDTCPTHPKSPQRVQLIPLASSASHSPQAPSTCPPRLRHLHDTSNVSPTLPIHCTSNASLASDVSPTPKARSLDLKWTDDAFDAPSPPATHHVPRFKHAPYASSTPHVARLSYTRNDIDVKYAPSPSPPSSSTSSSLRPDGSDALLSIRSLSLIFPCHHLFRDDEVAPSPPSYRPHPQRSDYTLSVVQPPKRRHHDDELNETRATLRE